MQNTLKQNTAILIFIRSNKEEAQIKNFEYQLNFQSNHRVVALLNQHTKKIARQSGLPTFIITSTQQKGNSFGERLANAFQAIYQKGYDSVIAIGNDCLYLTPTFLKETATQLSIKKVVLGPTIDGGVYIIGLHKCQFQKTTFQNFAWQKQQLFTQLQAHFEHYEILPTLSDADDAQSLQQSLSQLPFLNLLKKQLEQILQTIHTAFFIIKNAFRSSYQIVYKPLRAPPIK